METTKLFTGKLIKDCQLAELQFEVNRLCLVALATLNHAKPSQDNLEMQVEIICQDLIESFKFIHLTELSHIFKLGIRHELGDFTIFAPVEIYKWCKLWYNHPERVKLRKQHFDKQTNLLEAAKPETKQPDYDKWEQDAFSLHQANKKQFAGLHYLYDYLRSIGKIEWDWQEFREEAKGRLINQKLAGIGSRPIELTEAIKTADHAEDGLIKFVSIEIAMEKYFNQMG